MISRVIKAIAGFIDEDTHKAERAIAIGELRAREARQEHRTVWSALNELVDALDAMPVPPAGRLADALKFAKQTRDRNQPW